MGRMIQLNYEAIQLAKLKNRTKDRTLDIQNEETLQLHEGDFGTAPRFAIFHAIVPPGVATSVRDTNLD